MQLKILIEYENGICEEVYTDEFESFKDFMMRAVGGNWITCSDQAFNTRYVRSVAEVV